jgi:hypothetical protein
VELPLLQADWVTLVVMEMLLKQELPEAAVVVLVQPAVTQDFVKAAMVVQVRLLQLLAHR